jgi:hypothetical protein
MMKCPECGRFMRKECELDDPLEDEVLQWWSCKQHGMYPEHLYFKSQIKSGFDFSKQTMTTDEIRDRNQPIDHSPVYDVEEEEDGSET